jgi:hypothetical protein
VRQIDDNGLLALRGSRAGDKVVAFARYGSTISYPDPLPLASYGFSWDATRQIQSFNCQIADPTGRLAPWLLEDPLGVGGAVLDLRYEIGGTDTQVNLGPYRISGSRPEERWSTYLIDNRGTVHPSNTALPKDKMLKFVPGGATIEITAYDLGRVIKRDRLIAPESPPAGTSPTVVSEVRRLLADICGVVVGPGVADMEVSPNIIYERDRMDAVQDLCKRIFCDYRITGEGLLEIYSILEQPPVATLQGGPEGLLVRVDRSQSDEGLYNRFVVDGMEDTSDGKSRPVRSIVDIEAGVLGAGGPYGRVPEFYSSNMITTQAQADNYAVQMAASQITGLTQDLAVTCLPMPHLQHGDWVTVANPVVDGEPVPLVGKIKSMNLKSGTGLAPGPMELVVECSYWTVQAAIGSGRSRFGN